MNETNATTASSPITTSPPGTAKVIAASTAGTILEWYDYFLYGAMAAIVFNTVFFPSVEPLVGTLLAFATFGVGFVGRPLGALVFGYIGDRHGRLKAFKASLIVAGVATVVIGLLPGYDSIGVAAPILLVILRFLQGVGLGGEYGGAAVLMAESARMERRGISSCWAQAAAPVGQLMALGAVGFFSGIMSDASFDSWGWRIPFLLSIILVGFGYYLRMSMIESDATAGGSGADSVEPKNPIVEVFRHERKSLLVTIGSRMGSDIVLYVISVFVITYLTTQLDLPRSVAIDAIILGNVVQIIVIPLFAMIGDRIGRRIVYLIGAGLSAAWCSVFFVLLDTRETPLITLAICAGLGFQAIISSGHAAFHAEQFSRATRYSGVSVGYQLGGIVGGGIAPTIAVALFAAFDTWIPIAIYLATAAAVTAIAVLTVPERNRVPLD